MYSISFTLVSEYRCVNRANKQSLTLMLVLTQKAPQNCIKVLPEVKGYNSRGLGLINLFNQFWFSILHCLIAVIWRGYKG